LVMDCDSDAVIDTLDLPSSGTLSDVYASSDGKYLVANAYGVRPVWDLSTKAEIGIVPTSFVNAEFVTHDDSESLIVTGLRHFWELELPDLGSYQIDSVELVGARQIPGTHYIIGTSDRRSLSEPRQITLVYDVETHEIVDTIIFKVTPESDVFYVTHFDLSPDGSKFYGVGNSADCVCLIGYDLIRGELLFTFPTDSPGGFPRVTPDGNQVWLTHGGIYVLGPWRQYISIVDASSGARIDTISVHKDDLGWPRAVAPRDIRFLPDGKKAYVRCGEPGTGGQPLLAIDAHSLGVHMILYDESQTPNGIDIAPQM